VRLHFDKARDVWLLLAPERVIETEGPVQAILTRCDGRRTLEEIVTDLSREFAAEISVIEADVREMLADLIGKRMVIV
jgi:pyrroloquinoline quinone biosynthesis protein D